MISSALEGNFSIASLLVRCFIFVARRAVPVQSFLVSLLLHLMAAVEVKVLLYFHCSESDPIRRKSFSDFTIISESTLETVGATASICLRLSDVSGRLSPVATLRR